MISFGNIISAGDMSGNITSSVIELDPMNHGKGDVVSIQLYAASATHVGTVAVQGSNDATNWNAISLAGTPTAANGSAFSELIELTGIACRYLRVVYTAGSGAGSLTANAVCK